MKTRRAGKIVIGRECDISKNRKVIKEGWVLGKYGRDEKITLKLCCDSDAIKAFDAFNLIDHDLIRSQNYITSDGMVSAQFNSKCTKYEHSKSEQ